METRKTPYVVLIEKMIKGEWRFVGQIMTDTMEDALDLRIAIQKHATVGYKATMETPVLKLGNKCRIIPFERRASDEG